MKKFPKIFYSILLGWSLSAFGFGILLPYISVFFLKAYNLDAKDLGLFFLLTFVLRSLFQAYTGNLSDIIGRKNVIMFSLFGRFLFLILVGLLFFWKASLAYILISVALSFILSSVFQPVAQAAISDHVPGNKFLHGMSLIRVGGNLGWMFGPVIGGYLAESSFEILFFISGVFSLSSGIIFYYHFHDIDGKAVSQEARVPFIRIFSDRLFMVICGAIFLLMITVSQMLSTLPYFLSRFKDVPADKMGYIFAVNGTTVLLFQIWVTKYFARYHALGAISLGSVLYGIGYIAWGYLDGMYFYLGALFCISFAEVIVTPLLVEVTKKMSDPLTVGRYMGFYGLVATTGWSVGPLVGSTILDHFYYDYKLSWFFISLFAFFAGGIFFTINLLLGKNRRWGHVSNEEE